MKTARITPLHRSVRLRLLFKPSERMQRTAIYVRHHVPAWNVARLRNKPLGRVLHVRNSKLVLHIFTFLLSELGEHVDFVICLTVLRFSAFYSVGCAP